MANFKTSGDPLCKSFCIIQHMEVQVTQVQAQPQLNGFLCPLFKTTNILRFVVSTEVSHSVSFVHQCGQSCRFSQQTITTTIEREPVSQNKCIYHHDWTNKCFAYNVYCMQNSL